MTKFMRSMKENNLSERSNSMPTMSLRTLKEKCLVVKADYTESSSDENIEETRDSLTNTVSEGL
jgi:predicted nucleotidyltransferase